VSAVEVLADLHRGFLGGGHADLGVGAGAKSLRDLDAELDPLLGLREGELLGVGVGDDELDAFEPRLDHVVNGVAAGPANAEHHDTWFQLFGFRCEYLERHQEPRVLPPSLSK
jgi:hypothetical protein